MNRAPNFILLEKRTSCSRMIQTREHVLLESARRLGRVAVFCRNRYVGRSSRRQNVLLVSAHSQIIKTPETYFAWTRASLIRMGFCSETRIAECDDKKKPVLLGSAPVSRISKVPTSTFCLEVRFAKSEEHILLEVGIAKAGRYFACPRAPRHLCSKAHR